ncbi:carbohydrate porin [Bradyrhizobium sp. SSUT77]|uniref:carbohydrate porin n=1 Tax=Bradyrhizobium sp. SSUT77 TaxID=3040603 RepID=UPI002449A218|nr:carbohydrate porin [Bradyrhizobium sp. SSUT77]MDH2347776.1 carbohydrate porin [Bradyrhizobium sp. SSUT77]
MNSTNVVGVHAHDYLAMPPYSVSVSRKSALSFRSTKYQERLVFGLSLAACLAGSPALAQSANIPSLKSGISGDVAKTKVQKKKDAVAKLREKKAANLATGSAQSRSTNRPKPKKGSPDADPFAKFENLRQKGLVLGVPGPADTVVQDKGGVRSALADLGIGYVAWTVNSFANNLLPDAARSTIANQLYNGQNPTFNTYTYMIVTYDLSRYGIPDGQIVVGAEQQYYTWKPGGPDRLGISQITYYQTFFDKKLELKAGYLNNIYEFGGTVVGGNAGSNVFGPSSNILYQGGLSLGSMPAPGVNLKYNFDDRLYTKASVQHSTSPDGVFTSITENPTALNWSTRNSGTLLLDETGYKNNAAPGLSQTWLRAGVGFNDSKYISLAFPTQPRTSGNSFYYVAADRQLWQNDPQGVASRGIYGGFSVMSAPSDLNKVTQYAELRLYAKGLFDSRPDDQISLVATDTVWSNLAVNTALAKGNLVHWDSKAISGTYTAHLAPGIYTSVGLTYINNPTSITYTPQTGHALNFSVSTSIFF